MQSIGERLKLARQMRRMSLRDVGERAGMSHTAVKNYENGDRSLDSAMLIRLADAMDVSIEFLLRPAPELPVSLVFRKQKRMTRRAQDAVKAQIQDWLERYLTAEDMLPPEDRIRFVMPDGFPIRVTSLAEAEDAARQLRRAWNLGDDAIGNLVEVIEAKGIKVGVVDGDLKFDAATFTLPDGTPVIVVKEGVPGDRQRMSLAHELGHIFMDTGDDEAFGENASARFAGAFLIGADVARYELGSNRHNLSPEELYPLKQKYGVSVQAWVYRAKDLGIITPSAQNRFYQQFGRRRKEPVEVGFEAPRRLSAIVRRLHVEDQISLERARELISAPIA